MGNPAHLEAEALPGQHVYSICFVDRNFVVPDVLIIEAESDEQALAQAEANRLFTTREVWSRHRLVGVIPPRRMS